MTYFQCITCRIQCIGKSERQIYIRLNNDQKDVNRQNAQIDMQISTGQLYTKK